MASLLDYWNYCLWRPDASSERHWHIKIASHTTKKLLSCIAKYQPRRSHLFGEAAPHWGLLRDTADKHFFHHCTTLQKR